LPFCQDSLFFVICSQYNEAEGEEGADSDDGRSKSAKPGKAKNKGKKKEGTEEETEFDVPTWTGRSGEEKHHTQIQTKLLKSCGNRNCWGSAGQEIRHQAQPSIEQPVSDP